MRTTVDEDIPTKGFRKWIKNTVASVLRASFAPGGAYAFILPMTSVLYHDVIIFVSSQDTLFLPDDSFFSLYRVFGVTEVFNEVLGDYYMSLS